MIVIGMTCSGKKNQGPKGIRKTPVKELVGPVNQDIRDANIFTNQEIEISESEYTVYTYTVWDNMTNETSVIRTIIENSDDFTKSIELLYPKGVEFNIIMKTNAKYNRNNTINNWNIIE